MARGNTHKENKSNGAISNGKSRRVERGVSEPADWEGIDGTLLQKALGTVTACGGALRFGYTADGGAYALGIYGDGDPYTEYFRATDEVERYFEQLISAWRPE